MLRQALSPLFLFSVIGFLIGLGTGVAEVRGNAYWDLGLYDYPFTDKLMSIVSETAREANLDLASMTVGAIKIEPQVTLQFQVQPISIRLDGTPENVQEFLAALYDRVPVVVAKNASMVNLSENPSTQLELRFFLSPEQIPEEDS